MKKKNEIQTTKEDINFLDNPGWSLNYKSKETKITVKRENGTYELSGAKGLPNAFDQRVMMFVLRKFFMGKTDESLDFFTTRYEIAKGVLHSHKVSGEKNFDRIMIALEKWTGVLISFKGIFYAGDKRTTRYFSKIDDVILDEETKKLRIRINQQYFKHMQETKYYKLIDFDVYLSLRKATSLRLYEILCKSFLDRDTWLINIESLTEKMAAEKRSRAKNYYPSDIIPMLKAAIAEINQKTDLAIQFDYYKSNSVCSFKKIKAVKTIKKIMPAKKDQSPKIEISVPSKTAHLVKQCMTYFQSLPAAQRVKILEGIDRDVIIKANPEYSYQIYAYMDKHKIWNPNA
jgi:hypothetical protein